MADDEQFSLCWNNFNSNLSAGFHESLCRGDLVDVTLAAEGQFVKAHRLVLSVCSPYFRKMFTQMPANQHAFVFLKDVSHTALKDLIQFMYCGEVNVKQEALPAFISTAEALQIKGLTDSDPPPSQSPAEPSTPTPQIQQQVTSPRQRQRNSTRSYKIETVDDSGDDKPQPTQIVIQTTAAPPQVTLAQHHQQTQHLQQSQPQQQQQQQLVVSNATAATTATVVTHKRPARSAGNAPHIKRTKSTIDPLDTTETSTTTATQQITVQSAVVSETKSLHQQQQQQQATETEYIDLPIELPTKSEPDYTEETGEVEADTYVEDDSYGEIRYDDSYFETENEDVANATTAAAVSAGSASTTSATAATTSKAIIKQQAAASYSDSSFVETADQSNTDAQDKLDTTGIRKRGRPKVKTQFFQQKLIDKLEAATLSCDGKPIVYASTTKGAMKLLYDGHHFKYSFRKGPYSIFQCCYKENKEECKVRVVCNVDRKRVFPLDGEHVHFIQATDKSVTNVSFEPGQIITFMGDNPAQLELSANEPFEEMEEQHQMSSSSQLGAAESYGVLGTASNEAVDFREKIKKRLQKALLGKKK